MIGKPPYRELFQACDTSRDAAFRFDMPNAASLGGLFTTTGVPFLGVPIIRTIPFGHPSVRKNTPNYGQPISLAALYVGGRVSDCC